MLKAGQQFGMIFFPFFPGGVKSGFTHVDPEAVEKRLFMVKGKRNIKVSVTSVVEFERAEVPRCIFYQ